MTRAFPALILVAILHGCNCSNIGLQGELDADDPVIDPAIDIVDSVIDVIEETVDDAIPDDILTDTTRACLANEEGAYLLGCRFD